jgi:hypothetical protein
MSYWDDLENYEKNVHKRVLIYIKKKHKYKMEELNKEVELYNIKKELEKK